jgi:hypothetical protein
MFTVKSLGINVLFYFVVDKDRDGIAHEFYWSIRDRLSLNVLDVSTCI